MLELHPIAGRRTATGTGLEIMRQPTVQAPNRNRRRGFTLIELMVTLSVAAILLLVAIPSFKGVISHTNVGSAHDALVSAMRYARTEAVTRGTPVVVAASSSGGAWNDGWTVKPATAATVLRAQDAFPARYTMSATPAKAQVKFDSQGAADNGLCFTIADTEAGSAGKMRYVKVLPSGSIHSPDSCS